MHLDGCTCFVACFIGFISMDTLHGSYQCLECIFGPFWGYLFVACVGFLFGKDEL